MTSKRALPGKANAEVSDKKRAKAPQKKVDVASSFKFKSFLDLLSNLPAESSNALISDCKECFTCREVEDGDNYSLGSTFFLCANETPVCGMEVLAKKIFDLHTKDVEYDPATSGAEWWTQHIDHRDNIGFHWDRDYGMEEDEEKHVHPFLGTVTYLCVNAGPTVVLDKRGTFKYGKDISGPLKQCIISRPKAGKHITFDGELLHGAPSELAYPLVDEEKEGIRVTFLVNVWINHKPIQSQRLDANVAEKLQLKVKDAEAVELNDSSVESVQLDIYDEDEECKTHRFAINSGGDDYIIQLSLPAELKGIEKNSTVDCLNLTNSSIVAGELTESEDEDDDDEEDGENDEDEEDENEEE